MLPGFIFYLSALLLSVFPVFRSRPFFEESARLCSVITLKVITNA